MKKHLINIILLVLLFSVVGLIYWRHHEKANYTPEFLIGKPAKDIIEVKSKIAGKLVPEQEVELKSSVSGIVEQLFVERGDTVQVGSPVAKVKPAPEPEELENARKQLKTAEIQFEMEQTNYKRKVGLEARGGISESEMEQSQYNLEIKELELRAAQKRLRLMLEGYLEEDPEMSNLVKSTAAGVITDLTVREGQSITKRNTQNNGTTIAKVANMDRLLFKGQLGEYEISKLKRGTPLDFVIGAYNDMKCTGYVLRIAPQAREEQQLGVFDFEASIDLPKDTLKIRTGITVVAEFIAEKTDSVLCIEEKYLHYENDSAYVVLANNQAEKQRQYVNIGLSDGIKVEIKSGVTTTDRLKPVNWNE